MFWFGRDNLILVCRFKAQQVDKSLNRASFVRIIDEGRDKLGFFFCSCYFKIGRRYSFILGEGQVKINNSSFVPV